MILNAINEIDRLILDRTAAIKCGFFDTIMPHITVLGNAGILWIAIAVVLLLVPKTRRCGLAMGAALILCLLSANLCIKPLVHRARPFTLDAGIQLLINPPTDFSFPSGHTCSGIAAAFVILRYYRKAGIAAALFALAIAFSRIYLMVHYFSDVLVGACLGLICGFIGYRLTEYSFKKPDQPS